jgi:hydroxylamine reductase (hybrid-cluster protein)
MADGKDLQLKSTDPAVREMIAKAAKMELKTVWDRYEAMQPQCGFGYTGLCCRHCLQGPCRIDPFGEGPTAGISLRTFYMQLSFRTQVVDDEDCSLYCSPSFSCFLSKIL